LSEPLPTPERARELMEPLLIDYAKYLEPEDDSTPRAIHYRLQSWRDSTWVLDDAELLWNLADIAGVLDADLDLIRVRR
jgi:hypothetical protein